MEGRSLVDLVRPSLVAGIVASWSLVLFLFASILVSVPLELGMLAELPLGLIMAGLFAAVPGMLIGGPVAFLVAWLLLKLQRHHPWVDKPFPWACSGLVAGTAYDC